MPEPASLPRSAFDYECVRLDAQGAVVERMRRQAQQVIEPISGCVSLEMVLLPGGIFQMGSTQGMGYEDETPRHLVSLAPFLMGRYPVTQAQWQAVMGRLPTCRFLGGDLPVMNVSWDAAGAYCTKLAKKTGRPYHLPSEAQWEYACRAGSQSPFSTGETITTAFANFVGAHRFRSEPPGLYRHVVTPVDNFPPNAFGISDMHGNVWEWCEDTWHNTYSGAPFGGEAWTWGGEAGYRVGRGGSWHEPPVNCRSATRLRIRAKDDDEFYGFRLALYWP